MTIRIEFRELDDGGPYPRSFPRYEASSVFPRIACEGASLEACINHVVGSVFAELAHWPTPPRDVRFRTVRVS